jgi:hypothetical protein
MTASPAPLPSASRARTLTRWAAVLALLPTPLWFLLAVARDPGPAWRAEYHGSRDFSGPQVTVTVRRLSRYWDRQNPRVPGGFETQRFSVRFDTCLRLQQVQEVPFQLVASGVASFSLDGQEQLRIDDKERQARGAMVTLQPGVHHLRVDYSGRDWPSIALNASFDGHAPVAIPAPAAGHGNEWFHPRAGPVPCSD